MFFVLVHFFYETVESYSYRQDSKKEEKKGKREKKKKRLATISVASCQLEPLGLLYQEDEKAQKKEKRKRETNQIPEERKQTPHNPVATQAANMQSLVLKPIAKESFGAEARRKGREQSQSQ